MSGTLIISPHADDEVLGAFSFLHSGNTVIVVGIDEDYLFVNRPSRETRLCEANEVGKATGVKYHMMDFSVNRFYKQKYEIINYIEKKINEYKPQRVLIPMKDTNQDHQVVHDAALVALRNHDKNHFVPEVLVYETPGGYLWGNPLKPNLFRKVDINKKIETFQLYESQQRRYRDEFILENMAYYHGRQSNLGYAEGFEVLRLCQGKTLSENGK